MKRSFWLAAACLTCLACDEEPAATARPQASAQPRPQPRPREVLRQTTQEIRPAAPELQGGGAQVAPEKVTARDPITLNGNVYVVAVNRTSADNVKHAIDLYQAEHGEYPKNYQEFMDEIIKPGRPDGIALPRLPHYQEYGYDDKEHKLIVLEYPDRKR